MHEQLSTMIDPINEVREPDRGIPKESADTATINVDTPNSEVSEPVIPIKSDVSDAADANEAVPQAFVDGVHEDTAPHLGEDSQESLNLAVDAELTPEADAESQESTEVISDSLEAEEPETDGIERPDVFPDDCFTTAQVKGARNRKRHDPDGLDLRIEGLLFVTDVPLTIDEITAVLRVNRDNVRDTLKDMIKSFARRRSALELRERVRRGQPAFIIDLKPQYRPDVKPVATPALPKRYIETLALIALNQPLPQSRLVRELGSKVYDHVRELVERGLVSKQKLGLSYTLRTTQRFSSEFGLSNNAKDLKAMLARAMTQEERDTWDEYRRMNSPAPTPRSLEQADAYEDALDIAANELTAEAVQSHVTPQADFDEGPAVIALDPTSAANENVLSNSDSLEADWAESSATTPTTTPTGEVLPEPRPVSADEVKNLGRIESDSASRADLYRPTADEETVGRPLTRFEKLFMKLKQRSNS